ncbi:hypothetical protein [Leucobacter sp. cx-169]|uniref:hypothetical protein n=1 Tax=Leucobacter sp. cx-169 TaxID=2770549 RepID=UPI00165D3816|nr:hypothetical protein [Leucobacter sp. cx-169]MBC9927348.1 hypothetical protein [Leucobacter sp. cx-169]
MQHPFIGVYLEPDEPSGSGRSEIPVVSHASGGVGRMEPLRAWARNAAEGSSAALSLLWASKADTAKCAAGGQLLREGRAVFLSKRIGTTQAMRTRARLDSLNGGGSFDRGRVSQLAGEMLCTINALRTGEYITPDSSLWPELRSTIYDPRSSEREIRAVFGRLDLSLNEAMAWCDLPVRPRSREINELLEEVRAAERAPAGWLRRHFGLAAHH